MGKDKKKDKKKQGKGAEKTALKTAKKAAKREAKERSKSGLPEEEDIELILNQLAAKDRDRKVVTEEICEQPTPRVHASFTCNPLKENEFFLFGGEYYNGERVFVYNHLFRLKENKGVLTWSQVTSPNTPKPRSSHQAVASRTHLYIFGGEFTSPSQMQFYHHKDMWRLDAANCQWEEITSKNGPSPRSGHRAILWKNSMFVFGGFYDTGHDVRYFNDAYLFEFGEMKWKKLGEDKKGDNVSWPSPRSACGIGEFEDMIFVYGGYTKHGRSFSSSDDSHGIVHTDMWSLDPRAVVWTKVRRGGIPPSPRCGFSTCVHKKRNLVVFGGVHDEYSKHDLTSTFFNDIFVFRMDQRRWFPVTLRSKKKASGRRQKAKEDTSQAAEHIEGKEDEGQDDVEEEEEDVEFLGKKKFKKMQKSLSRKREQDVNKEEEENDDDDDDDDDDDEEEEEEEEVVEEEEEKEDGEKEMEKEKKQGDEHERETLVHSSDCMLLLPVESGQQEHESQVKQGSKNQHASNSNEEIIADKQAEEEHSGSRDGIEGGTIASLMPSLFKHKKEEKVQDEKVEVVQEVTEEDTNSSRPMKRINSHLSVRGNELIIFGGKVDADKREVTLDDIWTLDMSKLTEFKMIQQLSAAASFWVEDEDEEDEEDDGAWDSEDMEGSDSEDGTEEESEDDEEVEMETDADEKLGEGHGQDEADEVKDEREQTGGEVKEERDEGKGKERSLQEAVQTMTDKEVVDLFLREDKNLKELLFLRSLDPSRYLEVTMKVKAERLKTPEEREREELALQESKRREEEAAAAAIASMSREARRKRGMELRAELSKFEEEEIPKVGEGLKEFFDRTRDRWGMQAWESRKSSGKQMRRDGFMLAVARFEVLEPLVTEFARLVKLEEEESIDAAEGSVSHGSGKTVSSTRPREHK